MPAPMRQRLLAKATVAENGCLIWTGTKRPDGYGQLLRDGRLVRAHRASYETFVGPIPAGMTIDHTCHNEALARGECTPGVCVHRACLHPGHLEAIDAASNAMRGGSFSARNARVTACPAGHDYTPENTWLDRRGYRHCRPCAVDRVRSLRARAKERG